MESYYIRFTVLLLSWIFLQLWVAAYFDIEGKPLWMLIMLIIMVIPLIIYRMVVLHYWW